ncbi:MAG: type VII toxin-antitoxin system HepT family RNase toxin [Candidatus Baldrarchaeia archaeon]
MKELSSDEMIERIRRVLERYRDDILFAYVFGSVAKGTVSYRDIDIAVHLREKPARERLEILSKLVYEISESLGVNPSKIDLVEISNVPRSLKYAIVKEGIRILGDDKQIFEEALIFYPELQIDVRIWGSLDPDPKPDKTILESRVSELRRNIEYLRKEVLGKKVEEVLKSYKDVLAMERATHRAIEAILDICRHLVSVYNLGVAESYGEYPRRLADAGLMPKELAESIRKLAGLRNILVHRYLKLDYKLLREMIKILVEEVYSKFVEWCKSLLK